MKSRHRPAWLAGFVTAILVLGGCTTQQPGDPQATGTGSAGPTTSPSATAPAVPRPLDLSRFNANPCSALSSSQLSTIGLTGATTTTAINTPVERGCSWNDNTIGTGAQLNIGLQIALHHGLSDIYAQEKQLAYFQPVTISGYPAVLADHVDDRSNGMCGMDLAVSDSQALGLTFQGDPGSPACQRVQAAGTAVIQTLSGGS